MSDRTLYRDSSRGMLSGVCAGIANYFNIEVWLVRIICISLTLLGGALITLLAYVALSFMLEPAPTEQSATAQHKQTHTLKNKPWQQGQSTEALIATLEQDFERIEGQVQHLEAYVTSKRFQVDREFNRL
ncbi:envelope stress response membrane protein PspC [Vibrio sp. SM6]|uniref:Envelope stress response membrane protein PspC n=1 Tax=Vibrio agarilyticus TaxID=2726741 RepID=A0A7X8YFE1_9VIBR|nr:envelope stress response membrane protein PspC [Vibrio agarilyticus]NLS11410.1 envelope stress response membrane protein PspC [Vibrio agarilyticus]